MLSANSFSTVMQDVWHNYFAGFFLFAAQPFRPGDSVALLCGASTSPVTPTSAVPPGWFEGVCESVDLRCAGAPLIRRG